MNLFAFRTSIYVNANLGHKFLRTTMDRGHPNRIKDTAPYLPNIDREKTSQFT